MSIPLLRELHEDVRRLVIAGASIATDDVRLKRVLPQLQQLGEKAPIFKRVAEEVAAVTVAQSDLVADKLLDLAVLLQAVLHTQSSTDAPGELQAAGVKSAEMKVTTVIPYRKLKPLIDSLTQKGAGRLELIKQGVEDGSFIDIRTYIPAVHALRDSYSEIADYVADVIIPIIGAPALSILNEQYDMKGSSGDARMLASIYKLTTNMEEVWPKVLLAQKEGALPIRLTAIALTSGVPQFEEELLDLTHDKKKEVRSAALMALSSSRSEIVESRLMDALMKKDTDIAVAPILAYRSTSLTEQLLKYGNSVINDLIAADEKEKLIEKVSAVISCLEVRSDELVVRQFLMKVIDLKGLNIKEMAQCSSYSANILLQSNEKDALVFLHELRDSQPDLIWFSFKAAIQFKRPVEIYDLYEGYLTNKKSKTTKDILNVFEYCTSDPISSLFFYSKPIEVLEWDKRWVERLIALNEGDLVCRLVKQSDQKVIDYLVDQIKVDTKLTNDRSFRKFFVLYQIGYTETANLLISVLEDALKLRYYHTHRDMQIIILMLPSSYSEKIRQLSGNMKTNSTRDQIIQLADSLAAKPAELDMKTEGAGLIAWIKNELF
ncbi:hypothetical protein [Paenibacillus sp. L3-i20]|uniref:hypothetical protein n=1 Tax=Paenibacillus sp. L3-i20 TaxID=2905833 RepID=UPI001EE07155|nr:hypothetical protein [Paenibacillus sp. L3-i20]GKU78293.1 hypothetical protein L3i20_v226900 [Paenibacillus sp. L3-i20]